MQKFPLSFDSGNFLCWVNYGDVVAVLVAVAVAVAVAVGVDVLVAVGADEAAL